VRWQPLRGPEEPGGAGGGCSSPLPIVCVTFRARAPSGVSMLVSQRPQVQEVLPARGLTLPPRRAAPLRARLPWQGKRPENPSGVMRNPDGLRG
jgi:hypothetical protein